MLHSFAGIEAIDGVYWSLAVEMKFYLLVFLLVALGQMGRVKYCLGIWLALAIGLLNHHLPLVSGLLIGEYAGCFIAGATFLPDCQRGQQFLQDRIAPGQLLRGAGTGRAGDRRGCRGITRTRAVRW